MSERTTNPTRRATVGWPSRRRDAGYTLPELLVVVTIMGLIVTALVASIVVTLRNAGTVEGRINLAADEQALTVDLPTDLASAATVDTDPSLSPCDPGCPPNVALGGSNAALLSWETRGPSADGLSVVTTTVNVSYYFRPSSTPGVYQLDRIECVSVNGGGWTCETRTILDQLPGPPGGGLFIPGQTVPTWIIQVSEPLAPDAVSDDQFADASTRKDANRVVVTINGNGGFSGGEGGSSQISITAGGTARQTIPADSTVNAPSFIEARSKCGGPVTLILDDSGSIGGNIGQVENGAKAFIEAFAGTPTQVQIVTFSTESHVVGAAAGEWTKYYDMTDSAAVTDLLALVDPALSANGGTNWEDAWFRSFFEPDGDLQQTIPETVVFFTDGIPTFERLRYRASPGQVIPGSPPSPEPGWEKFNQYGQLDMENGQYWSTGTRYTQVAFNRADWVVDQIRAATKIIGVGVGGISNSSVAWIDNPGARYDYQYFRGYRQYQKYSAVYEQANYRYQRQSWWGSWRNISKSTYDAYNTTEDDTDGYRRLLDSWSTIDEATYNANNTTPDESDGYRATVSWRWISADVYNQFNTTADESDGYRDAGKQYVTSNNDATDWEPTTEQKTSGGYKLDKVYTPDGAYADAPIGYNLGSDKVLSRIVAGNDNAVQGVWSDAQQTFTNADVAEMYMLADRWDRLAEALRAVATAECGGTVTVSTRVNGSGRAPDPFTFQNSRVAMPDGTELAVEPTIVTTSLSSPTRTFDFDMPNGEFRKVDIFPYDLSSLTGYAPAASPWSCKAGVNTLGAGDMETIPIDGEAWVGVRLTVRPNEAVSCELNVVR